MDPWDRAAGLERCAIGWEQDALFYFGRRRQIRLDHAARLRKLMNEVLESI